MNSADSLRKRRRGERGQSLVEFALVLPLFLVIVMGTIDFGWAFRSWVTTTNAAREGARLGVTGASEAAIVNRVVERSSGILNAGDVTVTNAQGESMENVTVSVAYDHNYITPVGSLLSFLTGGILPNPLTISTSTTMRIE